MLFQSKHIYVGETRFVTKQVKNTIAGLSYESNNIYYYHGDHLGSAQLVTNFEGGGIRAFGIHALWRTDTAGADINARPYVWFEVFATDNENINLLQRLKNYQGDFDENPEFKKNVDTFIDDINRYLSALLKAGADPDKLGHPYPFSHDAIKARITDKQANEYFSRGTRAINIAIEKGIIWESQVDLLLQYTKLDEESLKAAERSNDPAMIEKIEKLWKAQSEK